MSEHKHLFYRRKGWWWHRVSWHRWKCATRPIHSYMSVAFQGFNTIRRPR